MSYLMTAESVFAGHPDKVCDQISDAILDYILQIDPNARVACECMISANLLVISGEVSTADNTPIPYQEIAKETLRFLGYDNDEAGFNCNTASYIINIQQQSPDIAIGVAKDGAGDQGIVIGYATNETPNYMPTAQQLANNISVIMFSKYKGGQLPWALPDGKCQVSVRYNDNGTVDAITSVVVSAQHKGKYTINEISKDVLDVCGLALQGYAIDPDCKVFLNPTGQFVIGGPFADVGLTGRKIVVDAYGPYCAVGGGNYNGKDPTKVDRSGAYMARYTAKNLVASGACDKCKVEVAYIIGRAEPASTHIDTFGTEHINKSLIEEAVYQFFDFTPKAIINKFDLRHTRYLPYASFGHYGREECNSPWEQLDMVEDLKTWFDGRKEN